ncbi:MAG: glycoside hydrolase family 172 protein [Candidatus Hodarchaeota archaeon]
MNSDMLSNLYKLTNRSNHRCSSYNRQGRNFDFFQIGSGKTRILADIEGPSIIKHFFVDTMLQSPLEARYATIRMYWDHEKNPSVEVPLGDFFGISNCRLRTLKSLMITINRGIAGSYGYNIYFPMPFSNHAKIEIENQGPSTLGGIVSAFCYHIDYEKLNEPLPQDTGYFHAFWKREKITKISDKIPARKKNVQLWSGKNVTGEDNYVILDAEGDGQLVGLLLNIDNIAGGWYGEGDDMIFIDDDTWPPSIHGTGSEEIFGGGASPKYEYSGPYTGFHLIENFDYSGNNGMYRWYIHDPIRFKKRIRWTIEHGHANNFENDYSSVAYWYQKEPHKKFPPFPPLEERIPRLPKNFEEIWSKFVSVSTKAMPRLDNPKYKSPEGMDELFQAAWHNFMQGKYQIACDNLKKVSMMLKKVV